MQRKQVQSIPMDNLPHSCNLFEKMPNLAMLANDLRFANFMEEVIYVGHGEAFHSEGQGRAFYLHETQSQDDRDKDGAEHFGGHKEEKFNNHGDSWHTDIYCKDEEDGVDIEEERLFIDQLTQRANAQRRRKIIRTRSCTKDEDMLICERWKWIVQDPKTGLE
ncbi:putative MO25-like protein [Hordeum vulgare]|nr:putative MO25-like protein [Hordeum vulgare]